MVQPKLITQIKVFIAMENERPRGTNVGTKHYTAWVWWESLNKDTLAEAYK